YSGDRVRACGLPPSVALLKPMQASPCAVPPQVTEPSMPSTTRQRPAAGRAGARRRRDAPESDRFFRRLVAGMRNGVLAITRDGFVAEINAEAQRIFQLKRTQSAIGRHFTEVLGKHPDIVRVLH